jgi:DNA-binding transcriptional LysR family regulator
MALAVARRARACFARVRMNVHHLELFYHVARHGGISRAARHMPYGIQQPAISGQLRQLETELGTRLFERTPFRLTPAGQKLFAFVDPFFSRLDAVAVEIRAGEAPVLRLGAAEIALRDHAPALVARLRARLPGLRPQLREGLQGELLAWLEAGQIDIAVAALGARLPAAVRSRPLLRVPLVLLVPGRERRRSAAALFADPRRPPLISLPATESLVRQFQRDLKARGVRWPVTMEADSLVTIARYVAAGEGVGLTLDLPGYVQEPGTRTVPLPGFAPVEVAALWRGEPTPVVAAFLEEATRLVRETWPDRASPPGGS